MFTFLAPFSKILLTSGGWLAGEWVHGLLEGAVLEKLASGGKVNIIGIVVSIISHFHNYSVLEKLVSD